jgi:hypothetical protein
MTDLEAFEEAANSHGGHRSKTETFGQQARMVFDSYAYRARSFISSAQKALPKMPPIYFDYLADPEVNAAAYPKRHGRHIIGVTDGAVCIIRLVFFRMLSDPLVLPEIGSVSQELMNLPVMSDFEANAEQALRSNYIPVLPKDPSRNLYAGHLVDLALDYLVAHELAHIANGHTEYWCKCTGRPALSERGTRIKDNSEKILLQTLEMDADCIAVSKAMSNVRDKVSGSAPVGPSWRPYYKDKETAFFNWAFAMCCYFRLFGDGEFAGEDLETLTHPPDRIRQTMALATASDHVKAFWGESGTGWCGPIHQKAIICSEHAFAKITGRTAIAKGLADASSDEASAHVGKLLDFWKSTLRSELLPYAHANLAD